MENIYQGFNIFFTYDIGKYEMTIKCVKYEERIDPTYLVNRSYNDIELKEVHELPYDFERWHVFNEAKGMIDEWYEKQDEYKTSEEWCEQFNIDVGKDILDPDGWDRKNWGYSFNKEHITKAEFRDRVTFSTCKMEKSDNHLKVGNLKLGKL